MRWCARKVGQSSVFQADFQGHCCGCDNHEELGLSVKAWRGDLLTPTGAQGQLFLWITLFKTLVVL
jgi:hypothetical protein